MAFCISDVLPFSKGRHLQFIMPSGTVSRCPRRYETIGKSNAFFLLSGQINIEFSKKFFSNARVLKCKDFFKVVAIY